MLFYTNTVTEEAAFFVSRKHETQCFIRRISANPPPDNLTWSEFTGRPKGGTKPSQSPDFRRLPSFQAVTIGSRGDGSNDPLPMVGNNKTRSNGTAGTESSSGFYRS